MGVSTKVIVILLIAVSVTVLLWQNPEILSNRDRKTIVVGEMQSTSIEVHDVQYSFLKDGNLLVIFPWDKTKNPNNVIVSPLERETYQWLSITARALYKSFK